MKKIFLVLLLVVVMFCSALMANAMTQAEKQALINELIQKIAVLRAQLEQMIATGVTDTNQLPGIASTPANWCHTFSITMKYGSSGPEVAYLQKAMQLQNLFSVNDPETISSFFGTNTGSAVIKFQEKYRAEILTPQGLTKGTGTVAGGTRSKLNQLYGCSVASSSVYPTTNTCNSNWQCSNWGSCINGKHTRSCIDYNTCSSANSSRTESEYCTTSSSSSSSSGSNFPVGCSSNLGYSSVTGQLCSGFASTNTNTNTNSSSGICYTNWQCTAWGPCVNSIHTKVCNDFNYCQTNLDLPKPTETEYCTSSNTGTTGTTGTIGTLPTGCTSTSGYSPITGQSCSGSTSTNTNTNTNTNTTTTATCTPVWNCPTDWLSCTTSNQQTRICTQSNCSTTMVPYTKTETRACDYFASNNTNTTTTCTPVWIKEPWSECNGTQQTRTVYDSNSCGVVTDKPAETQACCNPNWVCPAFGLYCENNQQVRTCTQNNCSSLSATKLDTQSCVSPKVDVKINGSSGPLTVVVGSNPSLNITWTSAGGVWGCQATGNWLGSKESSGSVYVSSFSGPLSVGQYEYGIKCNSNSGYVSSSISVNVIEPTVTLTANDSTSVSIISGNSVVLKWSATNATSCSNNWSSNKAISGTETSPVLTASKTFTVNCVDSLGNYKSTSVDVTVNKMVDIIANNSDGPVTIVVGDSVSLFWTSTGATSCNASSTGNDFTGYKYNQGSATIYPLNSGTRTYTISCSGTNGTATDSVIVNVVDKSAVDIKANGYNGPVTVAINIPVTLSWTLTNVTSCNATGDWSGSKTSSGTLIEHPASVKQYVYTISCTDSSGSPISDNVIVNVVGGI